MLPFRARMDLGAMAMKGYAAFPKAPALLEPHYQIVKCHIQDTRWAESYSSADWDIIISKRKMIIRIRITNLCYVVTDIKHKRML